MFSFATLQFRASQGISDLVSLSEDCVSWSYQMCNCGSTEQECPLEANDSLYFLRAQKFSFVVEYILTARQILKSIYFYFLRMAEFPSFYTRPMYDCCTISCSSVGGIKCLHKNA
jgi:hypothetical protein